MGKYLAGFAAVYMLMVLEKDGSLGKIATNVFKGGEALISGIKPITQVG
jgi:hypothetical protein